MNTTNTDFGIHLKSGQIGVIPTDTIYGICTSAFKPESVEKIYQLRQRNKDKPMIILISQMSDLNLFNIKLTEKQSSLLKSIWPGPVSVILPCPNSQFEYLHRGKNTLALRMPKNEMIQEILKISGPLVSPSANFEGQLPATNIAEAKKYFEDQVDFYQDAGDLKSSPSTLIDLTSDKPIILRQGEFYLRPPEGLNTNI